MEEVVEHLLELDQVVGGIDGEAGLGVEYLSHVWWFGLAAAAHISSKFSGLCPAHLCWYLETNVEPVVLCVAVAVLI